MKKCNWLVFFLLPFFLTSCMDRVSELYGENEYLLGDLKDYYYTGRDDFKNLSLVSPDAISTLNHNSFAYGSLEKPLKDEIVGDFIAPKTMFPSWFSWIPSMDEGGSINAYVTENQYASKQYIGKDFGRSECFAVRSPSFEYGIASRLYDGQLSCHTYHSKAFLNLDETGIGLRFPEAVDLEEGLLFVFRGGTDYQGKGESIINLHFSFVLESDNQLMMSMQYDLLNLPVYTNAGGDNVHFLAIPKDIFMENEEKIAGFRLAYDLVDFQIDQEADISALEKEESEYHFGLLLYEVMAPIAF